MENNKNRTDEIKNFLGLEELSLTEAGKISGGTDKGGDKKKPKDQSMEDIKVEL